MGLVDSSLRAGSTCIPDANVDLNLPHLASGHGLIPPTRR
jgi:hypothetical protein